MHECKKYKLISYWRNSVCGEVSIKIAYLDTVFLFYSGKSPQGWTWNHFSKSRYKFSIVLRARFWPVVPQKHSPVVYLCRGFCYRGKKQQLWTKHSIYCTVGNRHHLRLTLLAWSVSLDLCISGTPHHVGSSTSCLVMQALSTKSPFTRRNL